MNEIEKLKEENRKLEALLDEANQRLAGIEEEKRKAEENKLMKSEIDVIYDRLGDLQLLEEHLGNAEGYANTMIEEYGDLSGWLSEVWSVYWAKLESEKEELEQKLQHHEALAGEEL